MHRIARTLPALLAGVAVAALAVPAMAQQAGQTRASDPGFYVRGSLGYSFSAEDEIDYSPLWGLGAGYRFGPNFRVDATVDWRDRYIVEGGRGFVVGGTAIDSQVDNRAYMVNAYYDLQQLPVVSLPSGFRPYVGAGIGLSTIEVDGTTALVDTTGDGVGDEIRNFLGDDDDQFAWQLMAGAAYDFTSNAWIDLGYRYASLGEATLTSTAGSVDTDLDVHEIVVTLGYRF